ncbi:hypothetical protein BDV10DRAFT_203115 [Aspergillus recurvatus]
MEPQTSNSVQGRRRRTFDLSAMVVLIDNAGHQWIFKTDDNVAATREVLEHPCTRTNDDFLILRQSSSPRSYSQEPLFIMDIPEPSPLDHLICQSGHKTVNTERLPSCLRQSKLDPLPTMADLQREIGRLRQEESLYLAAQQHELSNAFILISTTAQKARGIIQSSLNDVSDKLAACEAQFLLSYNIHVDDTSRNDYSII